MQFLLLKFENLRSKNCEFFLMREKVKLHFENNINFVVDVLLVLNILIKIKKSSFTYTYIA